MPPGSSIARPGAPRLAGEVGGILTRARTRRGLSRQELADELGVAPNTLGQVERGEANPTLAYLEGLGAAYGLEFHVTADHAAGIPADQAAAS